MAGCGPQLLRASAPEDIALYRGIAEKVTEMRATEREALAKEMRNYIVEIANKRG